MFEYNNQIVQNDLEMISCALLQWDELAGKRVLVTGANGMISAYLIYTLMYLNCSKNLGIQVIALSRNEKKARKLFGCFWNDSCFRFLAQDVCDQIPLSDKVDFIFHFAGDASPYSIEHDPVGIMRSNLLGTFNVLELARRQDTKKVIFASTREVYGENGRETSLTETSFGRLDCLDSRSCYPESKRAAETLCKSYNLQYGVDFNTVRIAHSYGPGMKLDNDGRVMADLIACVVNGRDIVLKSKGEALRAFCYVADTVLGLFYVLLRGEKTSAYNLANEAEEISIKDLAELLVSLRPEKNLRVTYRIAESPSSVYCNYKRVRLDVGNLERLGWMPAVGLQAGLRKTLSSFELY